TRSPAKSHPQDGGGYETSSRGAAPTLRRVRWGISGGPPPPTSWSPALAIGGIGTTSPQGGRLPTAERGPQPALPRTGRDLAWWRMPLTPRAPRYSTGTPPLLMPLIVPSPRASPLVGTRQSSCPA